MLLSIILLNYTKAHLTIACLASLYAQFGKELDEKKFEIRIVDNASPDDSIRLLQENIKQQKYKSITLIENKNNDGFGTGCNLGAKNAQGTYLLFLNNDTIVKDRGILKMAEYLEEKKEISFLGGPLTNFDGTPQSSVGTFYTPFKVLLLLAGMQRYGIVDNNPTEITQVDWVKGALLMVRKEIFEKLQGFDEKIFMYTEDMELCYRAKMHGYPVYFYPEVTILHQDQGSSNRTFAIVNIYKNILYFYRKHRPLSEYLFVKSILRAKALTLIGVGKLLKKSYYIQTYEKALKVI